MASYGGRGGIRGEDAAAEVPRAPRDHAVPNRAEDRGRAVHGRAARRRGGGGGAAVRILDNIGDRAMAPAKRTGRLFRRILRPKTEQIRAGHLDGRGRPKHPVSGNEPFRVMAWAWRWPLAGSPRDSPPSVAQGRLGAGRGRGAFAWRAVGPRRQGPAARCRTAIGSKGTVWRLPARRRAARSAEEDGAGWLGRSVDGEVGCASSGGGQSGHGAAGGPGQTRIPAARAERAAERAPASAASPPSAPLAAALQAQRQKTPLPCCAPPLAPFIARQVRNRKSWRRAVRVYARTGLLFRARAARCRHRAPGCVVARGGPARCPVSFRRSYAPAPR